jgi:hypothetical protein
MDHPRDERSLVKNVPKRSITFREVTEPITQPVTKFGGQPVWLSEPRWPISRATGRQMTFLCQVRLADVPGLEWSEGMAYVFMIDEADGPGYGMLQTWSPVHGENAVILQGTGASPQAQVATQPLTSGPALRRYHTEPGSTERGEDFIECAVDLLDDVDPGTAPSLDKYGWDHEIWETYSSALFGSKLGGAPYWVGDWAPPNDPDWAFLSEPDTGAEWMLLAQMSDGDGSCYFGFGEGGTGQVFIRRDGSEARFLWQSI